MKFSVAAAAAIAVALASPLAAARTFVALQDSRTCDGAAFGISKCGNSPVAQTNLRWASVSFDGQPATFWSRADCTGRSVRVAADSRCRAFDFALRCVSIRC